MTGDLVGNIPTHMMIRIDLRMETPQFGILKAIIGFLREKVSKSIQIHLPFIPVWYGILNTLIGRINVEMNGITMSQAN
jgi:hypothetical protein